MAEELVGMRPGRPPRRHAGPRHPPRERRPFEDRAYVLDFLPQGNPMDRHFEHRSMPIIQAVGGRYFTLLELIPDPNDTFEPGEEVVLKGDVEKKPIKQVFGTLEYEDLTQVARENLVPVIEKIVASRPKVFIQVFNLAEPITLKMHMLELLPGIGKKTLMAILEERKQSRFEDFRDLEERLSLRGVKIGKPERLIAERIAQELRGGERYYLFIKPRREDPDVRYFGLLEAIYRQAEREGHRELY